jgi:small-conductance mechanosensitive channel
MGRVERVGWGQTRIRGRDTQPTYVPNSHFAHAAVTNMERITHRKFETILPIRFEVRVGAGVQCVVHDGVLLGSRYDYYDDVRYCTHISTHPRMQFAAKAE